MSEAEMLVSIHKALIGLDKRAERSAGEILVANFVDSAPLFDLLSTRNHQVIYGRRGTGKTHALKFLSSSVEKNRDLPIYVDLRSIGSNGAIYADSTRPLSERSATLIIDVLNAIYNELLSIAVAAVGEAPNPEQITLRLDDFGKAISTVRVSGAVEVETHQSESMSRTGNLELSGTAAEQPSVSARMGAENSRAAETGSRRKVAGSEVVSLNFGDIAGSLSALIDVLGTQRVWLLIDEWSEIPVALQPYLADLIRRTILPINRFTVKFAAIEHRSSFAIVKPKGEYIGIELGADVLADLNLDDFLVFDNDQSKATLFFKNLIYRHYSNTEEAVPEIDTADKLIQITFTQWPVFEEFVRAVEGVPRDALSLASQIAAKAFGQRISMQHVRNAARDWYQKDKAAVIRSNEDLVGLLERIIDEVIGNRKARAFLFPSRVRDEKIEQLFDSRLLHVLKRNISSHDEPGARYDVYKIDYGCYVDLINTSKDPQGLFEADESFVEVPKDDYRSIRRAILRVESL